jgi:hypothetical protein
LLDPAQREELRRALEQPPFDGGLWSIRKVARWIEERMREVREARPGAPVKCGLRPRCALA